MRFEEALKTMREGKFVQRKNDTHLFKMLQICDNEWVILVFCFGEWMGDVFLSSKNICADDWEIVEDPEHEN